MLLGHFLKLIDPVSDTIFFFQKIVLTVKYTQLIHTICFVLSKIVSGGASRYLLNTSKRST